MRIAIFHNFMDNIGGAEIVCLYLTREFNADLYTTNIDKEKIKKMGFEDILPRIKSIGNVPKEAPFRQQLTFMKFRKLNLKGKYDFFIIGGDWAIPAAVNNKPNLEYFHSPLNEIWAFRDYTRNSLKPWMKPIYQTWTSYVRILYKKYFKHVERRVCNSQNTLNRIKKYLNSNAKIIFPPVDVKRYPSKKSEDFWLSVNRLVNHKRVDIQLDAFKKIPEQKLIIVGSYEQSKSFLKEKKYLESILPKNVEVIHWAEDKTLIELYSKCKGFITTAKDEDFGMTAIEAMAAGKPVIAPNEGGYKESVIEGKTGFLIEDINEDNLAEAIKNVSGELEKNPDKYKNNCIKQAKKFNITNFINQIKEEIDK
jgi:glycosyltransferase involved in cell wall biosynthesis